MKRAGSVVPLGGVQPKVISMPLTTTASAPNILVATNFSHSLVRFAQGKLGAAEAIMDYLSGRFGNPLCRRRS